MKQRAKRSKRGPAPVTGTKFVVQIGRTPHGLYTKRHSTWAGAQTAMQAIVNSAIDHRLKHDVDDLAVVEGLRDTIRGMVPMPTKKVIHGVYDSANHRDIYLVVWTEA